MLFVEFIPWFPSITNLIAIINSEDIFILLQRGNDVPHSPVMYAYLIVEIGDAKLYIDNSKVTPEVLAHLKGAGVQLRPYEAILSEIER